MTGRGAKAPRRRSGRRHPRARALPLALLALSAALVALVGLAVVKEQRAEWRRWQAAFRSLAASGAASTEGGVEPDGIQQIWLPDLDRVDRCTTCHLGIAGPDSGTAKQPFRAHPGRWLETHRSERFGCTVCHGGQGEATTYRGAAHGPIAHWDEPMASPELMEARCGSCHRERRPRGTDWLARGRQRIVDLGCAGCHEIPDHDATEVRAPRLDGLHRKVHVAWLREWLRAPRSYLPRSRMGDFRLSPDDVEALTAFLLASQDERVPPPPPPAVDWSQADSAHGGDVFRQARCVTCHEVDGRGGTLGPALTHVGSKSSREWLFEWISDPARLQPATLMPRFRFSAAEARDLAAYLSEEMRGAAADPGDSRPPDPARIQTGRALFERRGCYGCHELPGFPTLARIGPKLSAVGDRVVEPEPLEARGLVVDRPNWIFLKLRSPEQVLETARMPTFGFDEADAASVMVALLSLRARPVPPALTTHDAPPPSEGEPPGAIGALMRRYRCLSCHTLHGAGGSLAPVPLDRIGSQLRRDYLARYVANPIAVRVGLTERMPHLNVSPEEAERLAAYFSTVLVDDALEVDVPRSAEAVARGQELFVDRGCRACHIVGDTGGYVGPDLNGSGARLKAGWTAAFLREPQRWRPGTLEPDHSLAPDEAAALTAYVLSLPPRKGRGAP
jgi:cytochrome c2